MLQVQAALADELLSVVILDVFAEGERVALEEVSSDQLEDITEMPGNVVVVDVVHLILIKVEVERSFLLDFVQLH